MDDNMELLGQPDGRNSYSSYRGAADGLYQRNVTRRSSAPSHYPKDIFRGYGSNTKIKTLRLELRGERTFWGENQDTKGGFLRRELGPQERRVQRSVQVLKDEGHSEEGSRTSRWVSRRETGPWDHGREVPWDKGTSKSDTSEEGNSSLKVRAPRGGNHDLEGQRASWGDN